eukprot:CAMPEP_0117048170 /NCGR_PEP_ID=MMETSP0472-20121206/33281_1 /TAXON_ID=693140 ORGANISM="Tiarina fusus, Strain LIS" /NCGR_SAMPLE_ID=MMETSP0472 /ASSEMBLY_ACC=CAM_ASM_000603 /LENGTH=283 /DNA_ID=CAMNT_0004761133 /DNA_START=18 /DNA_END=869 /DNA_ORIENTATION=-
MPCPICFEETIEFPIAIRDCGHEYCKSCIETWILRIESSSSDPDPTCPECRCGLSEEDVASILGRPLKKTPIPSNEYSEVADDDDEADTTRRRAYYEPDEFTRVYLEELEADGSARRCPSCRSWIILEAGCNNVMCRCGCKFCFCCGKRGSCMGLTFFNNILGYEDHESFRGRQENILEEDFGTVLDPIFEGDLWFATEEDANIDPEQFEGVFWVPIETEEEESVLSPLFEGKYWECSGFCEPTENDGVLILEFMNMWDEILFQLDPWDGDAGPDCFGATLFD